MCNISKMSEEKSNNDLLDWEYASKGISMWLNNDPKNAEMLLKRKEDNLRIQAAYAFVTVMNGVISYETDKIEIALNMLKEIEQRCTTEDGWIKTFKSKIFGAEAYEIRPINETLEEKVILADSLLCMAILTFLTQDISGLMKGSWLLRRAWKIYQQSYAQIYDLYKLYCAVKDFADEIEPMTPCDCDVKRTDDNVFESFGRTASSMIRSQTTNFTHKDILPENRETSTILAAKQALLYLPKVVSNKFKINKFLPQENLETNEPSQSFPSRSSLLLDLKSTTHNTRNKNGFIRQVPLSCPEHATTPEFDTKHFGTNLSNNINPMDIKRLMGAVSFGYGIFQLTVSLLPANILKFISFLGFEGNREVGISCLMYSKDSEDIRAPFATLSLLWYFTIGAQLFHLAHGRVESEIIMTKRILKDNQEKYATSAIFLFFRGRLKRLECNIEEAIQFYDAAYRMSAQKELKLLCLHEVGWCRLLQLDFGNSMLHFHELKLASNFSKTFYMYLTAICQGAFGRFENLIRLREELLDLIQKNVRKETQIDKFIMRRISKLPSSENQFHMYKITYWKLLIFEMLFLWNTLYACSFDVMELIISDCKDIQENNQEPSVGIANLILGSCNAYLQNFSEAIQAYKMCIQEREDVTDTDMHISAFAHYELAMLLKREETEASRNEARSILQNATFFKNYDFENRLIARIQSALRTLQ